MFDDFSKRSKAVRAALDLAEKRGWGDTSLADIAQQAGLSLADLRREFTCKSDILRAFQREVDAEVLAKAKAAGEAQSPRDRLFDLIMTRFELMAPYKGGLKRIVAYLSCRPGESCNVSLLGARLAILDAGRGRCQARWRGCSASRHGLTAIYGKVFHVWLDDDTPSLDKTMAALDKRLARRRAHAQSRGDGVQGFLPRRLRVPAARLETRRARRLPRPRRHPRRSACIALSIPA